MAEGDVARCAVHGTASAEAVCARCGAFACAGCLRAHGSEAFCAGCYERFGYAHKASKHAKLALALALLGLNCGFVAGLPAVLLAKRELAAIDRGDSPLAGRALARGALMLGLFDLAMLAVAALLLVRELWEKLG